MDRDGTGAGYDLPLLAAASSAVSIPVIASGGAGSLEHLAEAFEAGAHGVLAATIFHFQGSSLPEARAYLRDARLPGAAVSPRGTAWALAAIASLGPAGRAMADRPLRPAHPRRHPGAGGRARLPGSLPDRRPDGARGADRRGVGDPDRPGRGDHRERRLGARALRRRGRGQPRAWTGSRSSAASSAATASASGSRAGAATG